jgi:NADPH:quinone reductase-like Zn-dependent oxidoreductase
LWTVTAQGVLSPPRDRLARGYSVRNASTGSTRIARVAGTHVATNTATARITATPRNVPGSTTAIPFEEIANAHRLMESRASTGKIVLTV